MAYGKFTQKGKTIYEGERAISKRQIQGFGTVPRKVKYVDSLLVYNQLVNPYNHHTWDVREVFPEPAVIQYVMIEIRESKKETIRGGRVSRDDRCSKYYWRNYH